MAATRNSNEQILLHMVARAESGELRKALESNAKEATWYNEAEKRWLVDAESRPSHWRAAADEVTAYDRTPTAMRLPGAFGSLGQKPLVIISHGISFTGENARNEVGWSDGQARLTALSTDSVHLIAIKNSHTIAQQNPPLVAAAIDLVLQALRHHSGIDRAAVAKLAAPPLNAAIIK